MRHAPGFDVHGPDLASYDRLVVAFSGGKDSIGCLLTLLEAGVPPDRIDLYHHDVDGDAEPFMDWPSTTSYCRAVADALGVRFYLSWKEGGFLREMLRENAPTAPIRFQTPQGTLGRVGGNGPRNTRLRFPQVTADLNQRYCSNKLITGHNGRFISRGSSVTPHLGSRPEHASIVEFPDRQHAVDYANSNELAQLMEQAKQAAHWRTYIIEGGDRISGIGSRSG